MIEAGWTRAMGPLRQTALIAGLAILFCPVGVFAQSMMGGFPGGGGGPTEVGVVTIAREPVPYINTLPGRISASKIAEIRPQVSGIVKSVEFREGSEVAEGDLLYQLQSDSYEASLASAKAVLQHAKLSASSAKSSLERYEKLAGNVSQTTIEDACIALLQAEADVASAEASVTSAQINLDRTRITAPLSGAIGLSSINQGALVTASQSDPLATIRQLDPVYVNLVDSSANLLKLRKALKDGTLAGNGKHGTKVTLILEDGTEYDQTGTISEAETVVSTTTGTFDIRAAIPNPHRLLLPGMFVRASMALGEESAFLVPQRTVTFNSTGKATVLVVSDNNTAETRVLETSRSYGNSWVATAGLEDGDLLIVDGLQKISEGSKVSPVPVEINEDGVILQTISQNDGAPGGMPAGGPAANGTPPSGRPASDGDEGSRQ